MNQKEKNTLANSIATHLDTRDKRYMFLKCMFRDSINPGRINLEGPSNDCAFNIVEEFDKQGMLGSLMACMNSIFDLELELELNF